MLWLTVIVGLLVAGRREDARAIATLVPDCAVLFKRLLHDGRVPRRAKLAVWLVVPYIASPLDLIPDFIPVIGQLDDAAVVAVVLRYVIRKAGADVVEELWPGPERGLELVLRLAGPARARA